MVLTISTGAAFCQPVAAADHSVNSTMTNDAIQTVINGAAAGDTITFLAGIYNNVTLSISTALNLVSEGNEAILNSDGTSTVFTIIGSNAAGTNITGFTINANGTNNGINATNTANINIIGNIFNNTHNAVSLSNVNESSIKSNEINNNTDYGINIVDNGDLANKNNLVIDGNILINSNGGISLSYVSGLTLINNYMDMNYGSENAIGGSNVFSLLIQNNTLVNGDDGINIYMLYKNLTINNNTIINMTGGYADAISLVNHNTNKETDTFTTITNNILDSNNYGIFLGGNFQGNVSNNTINNSLVAAMNITGKKTATSGSLNANITGNNITNAGNLGIGMENPNVLYLYLDDNKVESASYSIQYNQYYRNNGQVIIGDGNTFSNPQNWIVDSTMTNDYIQSIINGANSGDTISFLAGTYNNIALTVNNALNLVSNGAILNNNAAAIFNVSGSNASGTNITGFTFNGNGTNNGISASNTFGLNIFNNTFNYNKYAVYFSNITNSSIQSNNIYNDTNYGVYITNAARFNSSDLTKKDNILITNNLLSNSTGGLSLSSVSGLTITNNYIDMYNQTSGDGISGSSIYSTLIQNNTIVDGGDAINIYALYMNLTINNNTINHMDVNYGDGISLVNHGTNAESQTVTTITNNIINNTNYAIFLGGNYNGTVSGNIINNSKIVAMNITGKHTATTGSLNANITNNNITNAIGLGISMENPDVVYLDMEYNNITSTDFNIQYNQYYLNNGTVIVTNNLLSNSQNFIVASTMTNEYIQSLIDQAKSGDTITFLAGTYNNIALTVNNALNLVSNGAILNNSGTSTTLTVTGPGASGTNITGFTITGAAGNGISLNSAENITISNNNITGNSAGLEINNSQNNTVTNNNISNNNNNGVTISDDSQNNDISNNTVSNNGGDGVNVQSSSHNKITKNTISNNKKGVSLNGSSNNTVSANTVSNNAENGVDLESSYSNEISNNNIYSNTGNGVGLTSSDSNTVSYNNIYSNTQRGISQTSSVDNNIVGNNIYSNGITVTVDIIDPANGTVITNPSKVITVTFSETIKNGTGWIELQRNGSDVAINTTINGNTLTITPVSGLVNGTYRVLLHTGSITDQSCNPVNAYISYFTLDTVGPTVNKIDPANNAIINNSSKKITVTFNEAIKMGTAWIELQRNGVDVAIKTAISGNTLTLTPTSALANGSYRVILHTGCVVDQIGNQSAAYISYFTVDAVAPKVTKIDPANRAVISNVNKKVIVTFNETIKMGNWWIELQNSSGNVAIKSAASGNTLTITPTRALANGTYRLLLHTACVIDQAGNQLAPYISYFTVRT